MGYCRCLYPKYRFWDNVVRNAWDIYMYALEKRNQSLHSYVNRGLLGKEKK